MGPEVSQKHHFYSVAASSGAGLGLLWGMKPPPAAACPSVAGVTLRRNTLLSGVGDQIQRWCKERLQDSILRLCFVSYRASGII